MCRNMSTERVSRMEGVKAAFTLIELMIVLVIIGIAAAMAVPMISSASSFQIRSAANLVAADLEYAKSMAISRGQSYSVVFDAASESYQIEDLSKPVGDPDRIIDHPVKKGFKYTVDFRNDSRINNVVIVSANFGGSETVTFDYLGSPASPGSPQGLLAEGVVTLQAGGITKMVRVEPVTGFISVSD